MKQGAMARSFFSIRGRDAVVDREEHHVPRFAPCYNAVPLLCLGSPLAQAKERDGVAVDDQQHQWIAFPGWSQPARDHVVG